MNGQTLADIYNGPEWIMYAVVVILAVMTVVLLTGKGANLIAGYNTASKEEQEKYDAKKLSRTVGIGFVPITLIILVMTLFDNVLPARFAYVFLAVVVVDIVLIIVLCNTICKK